MSAAPSQQSQDQALDQRARDWVARLMSGEFTEEDARSLSAWRAQSHGHERAFQRAVVVWRLSGQALGAEARRQRTSRRRVLQGAGLVTACAAAHQAAVFLGHAPGLRALTADVATANGLPQPLALPGGDGTLDGGSALDTAAGDEIRLLEGAVFLRAAAGRVDGAMRIRAGGADIALGAGAVEVRYGDRDIEIACAEGSVAMLSPAPAEIAAGQVLRAAPDGRVTRHDRDPEEIASWRRGLLSFRDRRLGDVVADLNRHRRGKVMIARPLLAERRVSGVFHLDRPDQIVDHLVTGLQLSRRDLPAGIVLLS
ncbi:MAG: DUF4880 domain-containing protein [Pseudomonadota bacterium]